MYPRTVKLNGKEVLVDERQMVAYREHLNIQHRILFLTGTIGLRCNSCGWGETESHNLLMALDEPPYEPIKIVITSPGGDLDSAFLFYDTMKMIKSPIITIGRYCASAAAMLLAAGKERYIYQHAKVMLHLPGGTASGDARDWEIQHREMQKYKNNVADILCECGATKTHDEILLDMDRNFWLEPQEAIDYGLADKILTPEIWQEWTKEI